MNCVLAWILAIKIPTLVPGDAGRVPILWAVDNSALPLHSLLTNAPSCHISCCHGWLDNLLAGGKYPPFYVSVFLWKEKRCGRS